MNTPATTTHTTVGALTANDIGTTDLVVRHEGSTISGVLTDLNIEAKTMLDTRADGTTWTVLVAVHLSITVGSITIGPLDRTHPCEVLA